MSTPATTLERLRGAWGRISRELGRFGVVGALAFVVDVGTFNVLIATVGAGSPLRSKVVAVVVATLFSWLGNRLWTYRDRRRARGGRLVAELTLFVALNGVALLISLGLLALSHYLLGLTSPLADNVSNVVGIVAGTAFRFVTYRTWVFREARPAAQTAGDPPVPLPVGPPSSR